MDNQVHDQAPGTQARVLSLLDRSDPAWRALYSLYGPDGGQGRAAGLQFSQANRQAIQRKFASRAAAAAAAAAAERATEEQQKSKASSAKKKVAVPHFKQQQQHHAASDPLAAVPRRRSGRDIQAAMATEAERAWGQAPLPSGRLIDEQEKQRCALLMQFRGNIPHPGHLSPAARAKVRSTGGGCSAAPHQRAAAQGNDAVATQAASALGAQRDGLQRRFQEAEAEVAERQEFVEALQQLGRLRPEQHHAMRAEVAAKVQEMRQLDGQIRRLDAQLRAAREHAANAAEP